MLELDFSEVPKSPLKITSPGRRWLEDHRDRSTNTGNAISTPLIASLHLDENVAPKVSFASESESQSGTDDYGSSDVDAKGKSSASGSGSGKRVGFKDEVEENDEKKRPINTTILANESDSDESSDSYGDSDDYVPLSRSRTLQRPSNGDAHISSGSSDDIPLGQRVQNPEELRRQLRYLDRKAIPPRDKQKKMAETLARAQAKVAEQVPSKRSYDLDADDLIARLLLVQEGREVKREAPVTASSLARHNTSLGRSRSLAYRKPVPADVPPLPVQSQASIPAPINHLAPMGRSLSHQSSSTKPQPPHKIQTANLNPNVRTSQKSSPLSPGALQLFSSSVPRSDSTEASMKTAREYMMPSSSTGNQPREEEERFRPALAEVNTRNRSRSQAQQYIASPIENRPPPLPMATSRGLTEGPVTTIHRSNSKRERVEANSGSVSASSKQLPSLPNPPIHEHESRMNRPSSGPSNTIPPSHLTQHRIYLLNKQRVGTAEVSHSARVRDVISSIVEKEPMPIDTRQGDWVLYDVCPALGIERPLREYEMLSDVISVRSNAQDDYLCIRRTELSSYLSIKNVPNSSASLAGWVHIRDNHKKKWNKRWLELRDNCLYIARSEKGKEEVLLCSLSAFDLYLCDLERCKTPKAHSFAMRSQNSMDMFESPEADYVHYMCLSDAAASRHWITAIINSRTFVLKQEKSQLFRLPSPKTATTMLPMLNTTSVNANHTSNGRQSNEQERNVRAARIPLGASSPSVNASHALNATPAPLLNFQHPAYVKGSLMEERFHQEAQLSTSLLPQSMINQQRQAALDMKRREEVQLAERKGRKEGKPLIGMISDLPLRGVVGRQ